MPNSTKIKHSVYSQFFEKNKFNFTMSIFT